MKQDNKEKEMKRLLSIMAIAVMCVMILSSVIPIISLPAKATGAEQWDPTANPVILGPPFIEVKDGGDFEKIVVFHTPVDLWKPTGDYLI